MPTQISATTGADQLMITLGFGWWDWRGIRTLDAPDGFLVEGIDLSGLVGGDLHTDSDLGDDGCGPSHG